MFPAGGGDRVIATGAGAELEQSCFAHQGQDREGEVCGSSEHTRACKVHEGYIGIRGQKVRVGVKKLG